MTTFKEKVHTVLEGTGLPVVKTNIYERAHGKKPKGSGLWMFNTSDTIKDAFDTTGTYSEAAKKAQEHFKGESVIYVLS